MTGSILPVRMQVRRTGSVLLPVLFCLLYSSVARAEDPIWATGRVLDAEGRPVVGALVAVYDDSNKVVDYARTDHYGEYALAVPPKVLHLDQKHGQNFFSVVTGTAIRFVSGAADFVANPVRAGVHAVTASEAANITDPITRGEFTAGGVVADQMLNVLSPPHHHLAPKPERSQPGVMMMKIVAPRTSDLVDIGRVYWVQQEVFKAGGKQTKTMTAWLDPVQLSRTDSEKPSKFQSEYLRFASARMEPSLAEPGQTVHISARLPIPEDPSVHLIVVARHNHTGQKWELLPTGNNLYEADIAVDKRFPHDDQIISIIAYASLDQRPGRRPEVERAIEGAGLWDPRKPYVYNPLLVVSRNRADVILTVVTPNKKKH